MLTPLLAQEATGGTGGLSTLLFVAVMVGAFYFLVLRPQRQRMKRQQELAGGLSVGDKIQTIGGIIGVVSSIDDDSIVLDIEAGSIRLSKRAIATRLDET